MKKINWIDGQILKASDLAISNEEQRKLIGCFAAVRNNFYGFITLQLDEIAILDGVARLKECTCIFPNGQYIAYQEKDYELKFNVKDCFVGSKKELILYLNIGTDSVIFSESVIEKDLLVEVNRQIPKLYISTQLSEGAMSMATISILSGGYTHTKNWGTFLRIQEETNSILQSLVIQLKKAAIILKEQNLIRNQADDRDLLQSVLQLTYLLGSIRTDLHPEDCYMLLRQTMGIIAWYMPALPYIEPYNHSCSTLQINNLLNLLRETLFLHRANCISPKIEEDKYVFEIPQNIKSIYLLLEPNNMDIRNWILQTPIASRKFFQEVRASRILGVHRSIKKENDSLIIELDMTSPHMEIGTELEILNIPFSENLTIKMFFDLE